MKIENTHAHRSQALRRRAGRFGLLACACLGTVGLAAGAAQAVAGVGVVTTSAHTLANPGHPDVFQDAFEVHQLGPVLAAGARNQAKAEAVQCSAERECRAVSLSFQVVTMVGRQTHLNAVNLSDSRTLHCPGCESLAVAYQFVLSTEGAFALSPATERQLAQIHDQLNALGSSTAPVSRLKAEADGLAGRVTAILKAAAATAPKGPHPLDQSAQPELTVHHMEDQH